MATKWSLCAFHFLLGVYYTALADKVAQKIYQDLKFVAPCVVLTNATHQIGCTSSINGHVGVIHYVQQKSDVEWILGKGKHAPYIPIYRADQFDLKLLKPLIDTKKISGALVIAVESGKHRYVPSKDGKGFSPDYPCPNDDFGMYESYSDFSHCKALEWNKNGNAMSFSYYDIPIIAVSNEKEVDDILQCFNKYNNVSEPEYPLCAAELKDFMFAAKDTPTCMRKTKIPSPTSSEFCQPLGDLNVWGTLYPIKEPLKEKDVVMLATKLDSSSFFHNLAPGVDNDGTGIVVALAVANALGELKRNGSFPPTKNHIMLTFFQGESWDYIGSSRMVYDMETGEFPTGDQTWKVKGGEKFHMKTANIKYYMELSQVGLLHDNTLWAHSDPVSRQASTEDEVKKMLGILKDAGNKHGLTIGDPSEKTWQPLPPASFQRFLRSDKKIPGVVLTDHKGEYTNKYYNSRFDDLYQAGGNVSRENDTVYLITDLTKRLAKVASTVATALFTLANGGEPPAFDIKVEDAVVGHLAFCFFNRSNCPLYKEVYDAKSYKKLPKDANQLLSRYVGVTSVSNPFTTTVVRILLYFIGYRFPTAANCSNSEVESALIMQGRSEDGICVKGPVYVSPALSPAFVLEQYGSTEYSTWAESTWYDPSVRIFLVASPELEGVTLAAGLIMTIFSFGVVFFVHKKADLIFTPDDPLNSNLDG